MRRRQRWILTPRGEQVMAVVYTIVILVGCALALLALLGLAGWVEGWS